MKFVIKLLLIFSLIESYGFCASSLLLESAPNIVRRLSQAVVRSSVPVRSFHGWTPSSESVVVDPLVA